MRAPACSDNPSEGGGDELQRDCFQLSPAKDFIVAYNPRAQGRTHGFQRRTHSQVDLFAGVLTQSEGGTADEGLIATHAIFMLVAWLLFAPWAIFVGVGAACSCVLLFQDGEGC